MQKRKDSGEKLDMLNGDGADALRKKSMKKMSMTDLTMGMMATERIEEINVFDIVPHPLQPRRAMPSSVRYLWDFDITRNGMTRLFTEWLKLSAAEAGVLHEDMVQFIESRIMSGDVDEDVELPIGDIGTNLINLASLAGNIKANGLTNPIGVYRNGDYYQIETGERRWLAFHLLDLVDVDNDGWQKIPARVMDDFSVWRQAGENNTRSDLNAISKARQFAILLMDLYGVDKFKQVHEFNHEQDYYAQVADGNIYRIPRNKSERLLSAMGLKHPRQLRYYRGLLRIPADLWIEADDNNWTEFKIRSIVDGDAEMDNTGTAVPVSSDINKNAEPGVELQSSQRQIEVITRDDVFKQATRLHASYESEDDELKALTDVLSVVRKRIKYLKTQGREGLGDV